MPVWRLLAFVSVDWSSWGGLNEALRLYIEYLLKNPNVLRLVLRQLTYLVVSMRQKLLAIPGKLYSRLGPERFPREAAQECEMCIHEVLEELSKFPECVEPNWLDKLEEKEV